MSPGPSCCHLGSGQTLSHPHHLLQMVQRGSTESQYLVKGQAGLGRILALTFITRDLRQVPWPPQWKNGDTMTHTLPGSRGDVLLKLKILGCV